eukprot:TRINITY_DN19633_c0_g1_i1.p1 TRINITY_DN19633_c0_g1~~TRINITY_DN19633_c0_g1_i1.p1  ORF type:complete len:203 (+),score=32.43 TRINITY_DN19633_c0_g1_i1:50-610(+)
MGRRIYECVSCGCACMYVGLEVDACSKCDGELCGGCKANECEQCEEGCSNCVEDIHFKTCGCTMLLCRDCAPPETKEEGNGEFNESEHWHDERSCLRQKKEAADAAKRAREEGAKQRMLAEEKRAQQASKVQAALAFMKKQTTSKASKAQHYEVIIDALERYKTTLTTGSRPEGAHNVQGQKRKRR